MLVIPAIDIMNGKCVRLSQGDFAKSTIYSDNPIHIAKNFANNGAQLLHIVDLDGAKSGSPINREVIFDIARSINIPVQAGGGIRSIVQAKSYLEAGIKKIILSTAVIENPTLLRRLIKKFGNSRIVVSVDIKDGKTATHGWLKTYKKTIPDMISILKKIGVVNTIVTDVSKDGLLKGPNFALTQQFINHGFNTVGAGGISSLSDIEEYNKRGAFGVIVGKAFYEGKLDLKKAQKIAAYKNNLTKRIIPCLDVKNGRVVKGTHFKNLRDAGDAVTMAKRYSECGADELIFLDIAATLENRKTLLGLVRAIAKEINIPFTVGGGIAGINDIRELLKAGTDKVSIGSMAVKNPAFVKKAVEYFGSQCIVISVDAKKQNSGWEIYIKGGTEATSLDAVKFSKQMEMLGAGELLVNSIDRDGTKKGFDLALLKTIVDKVNIPVIASSGAGSMNDFRDVFQKTDVDAALGASIFHNKKIEIEKLKNFLSNNNIPIRL